MIRVSTQPIFALLLLAGCQEVESTVYPLADSLEGIPFSNYRCYDTRVLQIAWNEEEATVRTRGQNTLLTYQPTEEGILYTSGDLVMLVEGQEVVLASPAEADAEGRLIGTRCRFEASL
jgi:hypothetical protein